MILVDTSIWVAHLRARDIALEMLLEAGQVLTHPFVIGELALQRDDFCFGRRPGSRSKAAPEPGRRRDSIECHHALGHLKPRDVILNALADLPRARSATDDEVLHLIDRHGLAGLGIGYVDAHLLAAVRLTAGATLWTRDRRFHAVADRLGLTTT